MRGLRALAAAAAFRWALAIAGGFAATTLLLFAFIYWQTAARERARVDGALARAAASIADGPAREAPARLDAWLVEDLHGVRYAGLFGPDGARLAGNLLAPPRGLPPDGRAHRAVFGPIARGRGGDVPEAVRGVARRLRDGRLLALGYDGDELEQAQAVISRALGLGLLPAVALSLAGGALLAWRARRRVAAVHEAVDRIVRGQLRERLPVRGSRDEFDKLAAAVNGMLDEIERLVDEIRGVGDAVAHDLRTPLTRARARLERGREEARTREEFQAAMDRAIAGVDRALAVVAAVLRIGEVEHGRRRAAFAPVDPAEVLADVAELYEPLAEEKGVALRLDLAPSGPVPGDRDLLLEAVGNLVDNAVKYAPPGTEVVLSLRAGPGGVRLRVADRGPGIPPAEREHVLRRFYRAEKSRTVEGSGLGLSLVAAVAALHGFGLRVADAGPGCAVEIVCPAASMADAAAGGVPAHPRPG